MGKYREMARGLSWPFIGYKLSSVPSVLTEHLCSEADEGDHSVWRRQTQRKNFIGVWLVY